MRNMRSINIGTQKSAGLTLRFVVARENGEEAKLGPQITMVEKHVPMLTDLNQHRTTYAPINDKPPPPPPPTWGGVGELSIDQ